jgi:hypothetical protein
LNARQEDAGNGRSAAVERAANGIVSIGSNGSNAANQLARRGYSGMIRVYWAAGISTMFLEDRASTYRFAVMKSAIENTATNDAHAN